MTSELPGLQPVKARTIKTPAEAAPEQVIRFLLLERDHNVQRHKAQRTTENGDGDPETENGELGATSTFFNARTGSW
jgi:hypothetical protein